MDKLVLCKELEPGIALVTINRPQALNALDPDVLTALYQAMDELDQAADIKVVIITGAGEKAFVAGADIASMRTMTPEEAMTFTQIGHRTMDRVASMSKVTIAAVNGFALGGGCELALACDIRIASAKARMAIPESGLGVIPGFGGTQRLPRLVGLGMGLELLTTGRQCKADECLAIGLVNRVVEPEALMDACMKLARMAAKNSGSAIALGKQAMYQGVELPLAEGLQLERELFSSAFSTADQKEGMTAFLEKRNAKFQ